MAQRLSLQFPLPSLHPPIAKLSNQTLPFLHLNYPSLYPSLSTRSLKLTAKQSRYLIRATENDDKFQQSAAEVSSDDVGGSSGGEELSELRAEIKRAMKEREAAGGVGGGFLSGVAEEIGQIEWPDFGKVLGTTGVVLGVVAGSSVVLLTLNAVLAELSDQVFAGKGIQDFFSG